MPILGCKGNLDSSHAETTMVQSPLELANLGLVVQPFLSQSIRCAGPLRLRLVSRRCSITAHN